MAARRGRIGAIVLVAAMAVAVAGCSSGRGSDAGGTAPTGSGRPTILPDRASTTTTTPPPAKAVAGTQLAGEAAFLGPVRIVHLGEVDVSYRRFGTGSPLLLIAGQASPMSDWPLDWLHTLAQHHTVTMYDNRGLGLTTDVASKPLRLRDLAGDAAHLVHALGYGKVDVLGWSTGGEIGMWLAKDHPDAVRKLVATGTTLGGPGSVLTDPKVQAELEDPKTPPLDLLDLIFPKGDKADENAYIAQITKVPYTSVSAAVTKRYADAEDQYDTDPALPKAWRTIEVPILFQDGEDDVLVPIVNVHQLAEAVPHGQALVTPGAGHAALIQKADTVLPAFERFYAD